MEVTKSAPIPPKKGLTKVQQSLSTLGSMPMSDNCPCVSVCRELGTYKQGACFLGNTETQKCLAATNLLLMKTLSK
ncbi:MAG: hypothetical protein LBQ83_05995 [Candidatus Margulisbacteria bacterium]|jgi:hypothetical protein|nr:hypothetical protein [Candidatus Margulisiibacteriota bacterium]